MMAETVACAICGAERPAELVEETTVATISPLEADICAICQLVQDHALADTVCMQCGADADPGFYIELEFPLGVTELPGKLTGGLCGDCAADIACRINYEGVDADPEAKEELTALIDEEADRRQTQPATSSPNGGRP